MQVEVLSEPKTPGFLQGAYSRTNESHGHPTIHTQATAHATFAMLSIMIPHGATTNGDRCNAWLNCHVLLPVNSRCSTPKGKELKMHVHGSECCKAHERRVGTWQGV